MMLSLTDIIRTFVIIKFLKVFVKLKEPVCASSFNNCANYLHAKLKNYSTINFFVILPLILIR
jgi:hypothetical protein